MSWKILSTYFLAGCWLWTEAAGVGVGVSEDTKYWQRLGEKTIQEVLSRQVNKGKAKNVILFVGDGMGVSTVTAGRIFNGQLKGHTGEEGYLSFDKFPHTGLVKTYNVDRQVPDSAGTATAIFSGIKTNYYIVGLDANAKKGVCDPAVQKSKTLLSWGIEAGKATGMVTTTRITHATPASTYAGTFDRYWECDEKIPETESEKGCKDIARQLVEDEPGRSINVLLGGGRQVMIAGVNESSACIRTDGRNLTMEWKQWHDSQNQKSFYVENKQGLKIVPKDADYVLGLFAPNHMSYDKDRNTGDEGEPSLEDMTEKAIQILSKNDTGFVLVVEGGRIDHAHHANLAKVAVEEVVAFNKAIAKAIEMTNRKDTLIIVTADHSHAFTMNGYPKRGNPIDGIVGGTEEGFPYQTLSYMNGPGFDYHRVADISGVNQTKSIETWRNLNVSQESHKTREELRKVPHQVAYWAEDETHGGEDIPVYAAGPMAHLVEGVHEQTHVAYVVAYASCIGPYKDDCHSSANTSILSAYFKFILMFTLLFKYIF